MFKNIANTMFNNATFRRGKIRAMKKIVEKERTNTRHETSSRLYDAVKKIKNVEPGPTIVARLLHCEPQNVKNWETRGVSAEAMLDAQKYLGCNAVWIRDGTGPMVVGDPMPPIERGGGLADSLKLTCESAAELQMLSVHRLSNERGRALIDHAVDQARKDLGWSGTLGESK